VKRVVFKFKDGIAPDHMNIAGDCFDLRDGFIYVWNGEDVVAMVRVDIVNLVCISEKKENT
jgi:hypothetical protein